MHASSRDGAARKAQKRKRDPSDVLTTSENSVYQREVQEPPEFPPPLAQHFCEDIRKLSRIRLYYFQQRNVLSVIILMRLAVINPSQKAGKINLSNWWIFDGQTIKRKLWLSRIFLKTVFSKKNQSSFLF